MDNLKKAFANDPEVLQALNHKELMGKSMDGEFLNALRTVFKGEQGYTPEKGKDYFTEEELKAIKAEILRDATPVKYKDYFTEQEVQFISDYIRNNLKNEVTPIKGVDYFDGLDGKDGESIDEEQLLSRFLAEVPKPEKVDFSPLKEEIKKEIQDLIPKNEDFLKYLKSLKGNDRLDVSNIRNAQGYKASGGFNMNDQRWHGSGLTKSEADATYVPYTGATKNVDLGAHDILADTVSFNTANTATDAVGRLRWNQTAGTLNLGLRGGNTILQIGEEEVRRVHNNTGAPLTDGQVVYVTGATGQLPTVALALATSDTTSATIYGVVTEPIPNGQDGFITVSGFVNNLNTNAYNEGDLLWLSSTVPGGFTNVKPTAPDHLVLIGYVIKKSGGAGIIDVCLQNGYELSELHDVLITNPKTGQLLTYNEAGPYWQNQYQKASPIYVFDGGGSAIVSGMKGTLSIPYNMTITGWEITSEEVGDIVVDIKKSSYAGYPGALVSIAGTEKPTLSSAQKNQDNNLTTWTTNISAGDKIQFVVDSATTVQNVTVSLVGYKT